jgi:AcrR family transcriptional regulator
VKKARKKPAQNGNRREDLLRVCARLFRERGFDGTSIRDISGAAAMHSGSPFYHFKSKQEMLVAVMEQGLTEGLKHLEAVAALRLAPQEKFRRLVRAHLETICGDGHDFIPVMLYDWRSLTPVNRRRVRARRKRARRIRRYRDPCGPFPDAGRISWRGPESGRTARGYRAPSTRRSESAAPRSGRPPCRLR